MVDETTKVDAARQDRLRAEQAEKPKPKTQESEFGELLKKGQLAQPLSQQPTKTVTEQAIRESAKHEERSRDDKEKDEREEKGKKESRSGGERHDVKSAEQRVVAKGTMGQGGRGSGGQGKEGGFEGSMGRRGLATKLTRAGAKSIPVDLSGKFAAKMSQLTKTPAAQQAVLSQQVLGKLVQYVRIGLNRAGEKEIQLDLHGDIFRGLKLRVTARGGKVHVHLRTADTKARQLFEKNRGAISKALADKGIEVEELVIT